MNDYKAEAERTDEAERLLIPPIRRTGRPQTIEITVEGGVIQNITGIPKGVRVRVSDYDIEGAMEGDLTKDEEGQDCIETIWK